MADSQQSNTVFPPMDPPPPAPATPSILPSKPEPDGDKYVMPNEEGNPDELIANEEGNPDELIAKSHMPKHFDIFTPFLNKFTEGEKYLTEKILAIMAPYGIKILSKKTGTSRSNSNPNTKAAFPSRSFTYICGCCNKGIKDIPEGEEGECGFLMALLLQDKGENTHKPFLQIRKFNLPPMSRHLLISYHPKIVISQRVK